MHKGFRASCVVYMYRVHGALTTLEVVKMIKEIQGLRHHKEDMYEQGARWIYSHN